MPCLVALRNALLVLLGASALAAGQTNAEWTAVINMAGRQRMLSQKMSKEFLLVAKGIDATANRANMEATATLFETSLAELISGSSDGTIISPPTTAIDDQLAVVQGLWGTFGALLRDNVAASPISAAVLESVATQSGPILVQMNAAVTMYATAAGSAAPGAVVNIAGRQRMLSQKMSKEALLVGLNVDAANTLTSLSATRDLFATSYTGLVDGDSDMGLNPTSDTCILQQMDVVSGVWADFVPLIDAIISSGAATDAALEEIAILNPTLLAESNKAVTMYVTAASGDALTCAAGDNTLSIKKSVSGGPFAASPGGAAAVAAAAAALGLSLFLS